MTCTVVILLEDSTSLNAEKSTLLSTTEFIKEVSVLISNNFGLPMLS